MGGLKPGAFCAGKTAAATQWGRLFADSCPADWERPKGRREHE